MVNWWGCSLVDEYGLHIIENGSVPLYSIKISYLIAIWLYGHVD